ncbi:hypothetical protein LMG7974_01634 [Campylobacter majalis]|uniref:Uncharacterized protein n=1 Tax=Campylobacter majalis TaxID=2790656 RepID=A0ABM8Q986_9BACT|nr:hypothetical protein [Campylobacter majalis]CAD7289557.1 hypothetical protein LMG7974_01634 [Campylobacter majalis]
MTTIYKDLMKFFALKDSLQNIQEQIKELNEDKKQLQKDIKNLEAKLKKEIPDYKLQEGQE